MKTKLTRRSFLASTATAMVAATSLVNRTQGAETIPGFNQPGYYAHLSAMKDGETLKIPQYALQH